MYKDISDMVEIPAKVINKEMEAFNVPFLRYAGGSYFGDEDCLIEIDRADISENKKYWRQSTVQCMDDAEICFIKKNLLVDELGKFS